MTPPNTPNTSPSPASAPAASAKQSDADLADATILLVDDNEQNLELLQAYLEELPCKLVLARDGDEALKAVEQTHPDLVLLDIMMPRMSGFQVCSRLKASPATRDIPVVMVTALNEVSDVERAVDCGADDFLTKPVHRVELLTRTRSFIRLRHLRTQLNSTLAELRSLKEHRQ
ncbi:MAG: response regulator [Phycisphaerales bacterium]|nr:response regulator [Phycisphaerales bacterium]